MKKRVYIIHGWDGTPEEHWLPWLKKELESKGFEVFAPLMPNTEEPEIEAWLGHLEKTVGKSDEQTFFIGHSIGCQAILRYLERIEEKVGGVVFVAGFFDLPYLETEEEKVIAKPWLETPIDFEKVKKATSKFVTILSDNDVDVPFEISKEKFKKHLNSKIIEEHGKGHFTEEDGVIELPSALEALLEISK